MTSTVPFNNSNKVAHIQQAITGYEWNSGHKLTKNLTTTFQLNCYTETATSLSHSLLFCEKIPCDFSPSILTMTSGVLIVKFLWLFLWPAARGLT